jgi:YjbE family integral membrane protein
MISEPKKVVEFVALPIRIRLGLIPGSYQPPFARVCRSLKLSTNSESFWLTESPELECLTMLVQISQEIVALSQVVFIDLVLAGDNAIVIGLAAAGLPLEQRGRAILVGIAAATVLRITFALAATQLLQVVGLALVGGILLLWVSWKMVRELQTSYERNENASETVGGLDINTDGTISERAPQKSFRQAATQIVVADVSMSLDNVLAVAGAAREHATALVFGLALSIALMGIAASYIARFLNSYRWVAYGGVLLILYVAVEMIYRGVQKIWPLVLETA